MKISNYFSINLKKLRTQKLKALFLIIPVSVLMLLAVVISSQVKNFQEGINVAVFETLKSQATLLQIQKNPPITTTGGPGGGGATVRSFQIDNFNNTFSAADLAAVAAVDGVTSASLNASVPVRNVQSSDLFEGKTFTVPQLSELDAESAKLFTEENFDYVEGEPIPIILNANAFNERYEEWGDKTEITIDFGQFRRGAGGGNAVQITPDNNMPIKSRAIEYDKENLIGTEFSMDIGGLDEIQDYTVEFADGSQKFRKYTAEEMAAKEAARKTAIGAYWDYEKISTPQTYTFKVVGIIEGGLGSAMSYVPTAFAEVAMKNYVQNQLDAKHTDVPLDKLDKDFLGISFDGNELSSGTGFGFSRAIGGGAVMFGGPAAASSNNNATESYNIPGLVIKTKSDGSSTVEGIYGSSDVYAEAVKSAEYMTIKVDSVYTRDSVVKKLNDLGYAYQDVNNYAVFEQIQTTIHNLTLAFAVGFVVIIAGVVLFAMTRFVADSRKEIGIFRAMGMRRGSVALLFTLQAVLYTAIAYACGVVLGLLINTAIAPIVSSQFDGFVNSTIKATFNVVEKVDAGLFTHVDVQTVATYSAMLLVLALVISLIPALRASRVSPIEAMKSE